MSLILFGMRSRRLATLGMVSLLTNAHPPLVPGARMARAQADGASMGRRAAAGARMARRLTARGNR